VLKTGNRVGWLLLTIALLGSYLAFASGYYEYKALRAEPLPGAVVIAWLGRARSR
jgi:uncharacterized membrane protein